MGSYRSYIPKGTYPTEDSIDGAVGAVEDPSTIPISAVGLESSLDFQAAWPLIWPQKTILFQTDDEYYESTGNFSGFWNSKRKRKPHCKEGSQLTSSLFIKRSSML